MGREQKSCLHIASIVALKEWMGGKNEFSVVWIASFVIQRTNAEKWGGFKHFFIVSNSIVSHLIIISKQVVNNNKSEFKLAIQSYRKAFQAR